MVLWKQKWGGDGLYVVVFCVGGGSSLIFCYLFPAVFLGTEGRSDDGSFSDLINFILSGNSEVTFICVFLAGGAPLKINKKLAVLLTKYNDVFQNSQGKEAAHLERLQGTNIKYWHQRQIIQWKSKFSVVWKLLAGCRFAFTCWGVGGGGGGGSKMSYFLFWSLFKGINALSRPAVLRCLK